jgi:hypothetical protein
LHEKHKQFVEHEYDQLRQLNEKVTKKLLNEIHPRPVLNIVALATEASIEGFVRRYETLLEFQLLRPNQELQGRALWQGFRGCAPPSSRIGRRYRIAPPVRVVA